MIAAEHVRIFGDHCFGTALCSCPPCWRSQWLAAWEGIGWCARIALLEQMLERCVARIIDDANRYQMQLDNLRLDVERLKRRT